MLADVSFLFIFVFVIVVFQIVFLSFILLSFDNPIYSIFLLVLVFFGVGFLLMELNLFFLSLMILIIYLGALIVLFLFVVMMLNIKALELNRTINFFPSVFIIISSVILFLINNNFSFVENYIYFVDYTSFYAWQNIYFGFSSLLTIGFMLYSFEFPVLILASLVLLVAMFGAIVLTLNVSRFINRQRSVEQVSQFTKLQLVR